MPRFIAVDPSTTFTGWAVFQDEGLVAWGHINTQGAPYADRFSYIVEELAAACVRYGAVEIIVEDVSFAWHSKKRNRNIAGLQVVFRSIKDFADSIKLTYSTYNPSAWKTAIVGHHAATKEITKENICFRFPSLPRNLTEHEYDAIALGTHHANVLRMRELCE